MCGIYITNIPFQEEEVKVKLKKIQYRGPDYLGVIKKNLITLGHLRLSILDLDSRSNQPYQFEHLIIVYNGEIYNFKEIKNQLIKIGYIFNTTSDTEVLLKGYYEWGDKILEKLNGMFAFAIYDLKNEEVFCARDRLGVKPFYYYWKNGQFEICSQLQPLMNDYSQISTQAISVYLSTGYIPSPLSILEDVFKLEPGYTLTIQLNSKKIIRKKYWDLNKVETLDITYDDAKLKLEELIRDAVKIRMQSDVPLGTFLSGGIDSALVTSIAAKISKSKIKTFTIGFDDPKYDESNLAEEFASIIGTEHKTIKCTEEDVLELIPKLIEAYDEPFADSSALPSLLLNKKTKEHVTVALSGDGGDESFIGYNHFKTISKFEKLNRIPFFLRKSLSFLLPKENKYKIILECKSEDEFIKRIFVYNQLFKNENTLDILDLYYTKYKNLSANPIQKAADLNIKLWLENDSNVKVDRASMAFSVEVRSPFLDYRIVEFARKLPLDFKFNGNETKKILKDVLSNYIPSEVFNKPKSGFSIPLYNWMQNELKQEIDSNIRLELFKKIRNFDKIYEKIDFNNNLLKWRIYILSKWINLNFRNNDNVNDKEI